MTNKHIYLDQLHELQRREYYSIEVEIHPKDKTYFDRFIELNRSLKKTEYNESKYTNMFKYKKLEDNDKRIIIEGYLERLDIETVSGEPEQDYFYDKKVLSIKITCKDPFVEYPPKRNFWVSILSYFRK